MAIHRGSWRVEPGRWAVLAIVAAACGVSVRAQDPPAAPTPAADEADASGGQVLTQGPVHEAFAAPVVHDPKASPLLTRQPPDPIQELPPDQRPAGRNVQWIPGYWAWDATRDDYLWISGVWREPPPGTQWVPGYWHAVDGGYQWVPGSWMPSASGQAPGADQPSPQATYLPPPPASLEAGPSSPQPGPNTTWTPGYWDWQGGGYAWRPGFWAAVQPNWIWMPAHYVWTPGGFLFVPGYWDLPVAGRGLMFAPVYYPQPVYAQVGFVYTPTVAIVGPAMISNLFVSVGTGQYLFGDYYAASFATAGIVPWFSFSVAVGRPVYYDPLFSYYAVVNVRQDPRWIVETREAYIVRRDNVAMRPPRTYAEQVRITRDVTITRNINVADHRSMAMPLHQLAARDVHLEHVAAAERRQIRRQATELHQLREQRVQLERQASRGGPASRPRTVSLPHSPVGSRPASHPAGHPGAHPANHPAGHVAGHPTGAPAAHPAGAPAAHLAGHPAAHPAGHPAAHPGADGARMAVAHREAPAGGHEAARLAEPRIHPGLGPAQAHRPLPSGAPAASAMPGHRPAMGGPAAHPGYRPPARPGPAPRGRERPAPGGERERRPAY